MKPLHVALVHRDSQRCREGRMVGYWSYEVPEFTWDHFSVRRGFRIDKDKLAAQGYDLIVYEDAKIRGEFVGVADIPICYVVVDSTLSEQHYQHRRREAQKADLVLVDWDSLCRFKFEGSHRARWSHCVNDRYFKDYGLGKDIDIGSFQGTTPERARVDAWLADYASSRGYRFEKGIRGWDDYAKDMSRCKVVMNVNRSPTVRSHRIFDAMACGSCLVTSPAPDVYFEPRQAGRDYVEYYDLTDLGEVLDDLLDNGTWEQYADSGSRLVQRWHTWAVRARQLRAILEQTGLA